MTTPSEPRRRPVSRMSAEASLPHAYHDWQHSKRGELWSWLAIYMDEIAWRRRCIADGQFDQRTVDSLAREIQSRVETCRLIAAELKARGIHPSHLPDFD